MTLIDSHCHLDYDYSPKTTDQIVQEALDQGVTHLVTIGTDWDSLAKIEAIAGKYPQVFFTVGIHPHDTKSITQRQDLDRLKTHAANPKCRAIGEIGLDYYYDHSPPDVQTRWLEAQLDTALELQLPVVIHARDAEEPLIQRLSQYCQKLPQGKKPGVIHCFTGTLPFAKKCIELGFYISFSGILTFKNAEDLRTTAAQLPLNRLLVETDSPFLAPVPFRGKKCEPQMIRHTAATLAQTLKTDLDTLSAATAQNTRELFQF